VNCMSRVDPNKQRRDAEARRRLAMKITPGLPVDSDVVETRVPVPTMAKLVDGLLDVLLTEKSAFFDEVCAKWNETFPNVAACPGRWQSGRLFLYVRSSGQLFALRPKLSSIKKTLSTFPTAPKRFTVGLEIHSQQTKVRNIK